MISRRHLLAGGAGLILTGCDRLNDSSAFRETLRSAEGLTMKAQRLITDRNALAREFSAADLSPVFRSNGSRMPQGDNYRRLAGGRFADWRLRIDGLVQRPLALSLDRIMTLPRRTQITRHDCVEGWSAIGQWTGVPLGDLMRKVVPLSNAKFAVFHCADVDEEG